MITLWLPYICFLLRKETVYLILPYEVKALLELFCFKPNMIFYLHQLSCLNFGQKWVGFRQEFRTNVYMEEWKFEPCIAVDSHQQRFVNNEYAAQ